MKNQKFWWAFIAFVVAWSIYEFYPPSNRDLIEEFDSQAAVSRKDATYKTILAKAVELKKADPRTVAEFGNLLTAIGTNNIQLYFPEFADKVKNEKDPTYAVLNLLQKKAAGKVHLGLDLQGGSQFRVQLVPTRNGDTNKSAVEDEYQHKRLTEQAVEVLRKRVDRLGVAEPLIQPSGNDTILIQLPGLSQVAQDEAKNNIQKAAYLEFRMVHPESAKLLKEGIIEPGYEILKEKVKEPNGTEQLVPYLVEKRLANGLTGKYIKSARAARDQMGVPLIQFNFNDEGARRFGEVTKENIGRQLAIVLDGELYSAPRINSVIYGSGEITGHFSWDEAERVANALENPLEAPVKIVGMSQVDPTLGMDTIRSGIIAAILGTVFVAIFMVFYYMRCGLIADIAMILNLVVLLGVMCSVGTTLTLPGIAGIVLTIGMAVDANVLIYERLREEMALGKSMRGAISAAYSRAFSTIFDSNITTLISSIILIYLGTGPIKGFGVTLTIGVIISMFTALIVTRLIFDFLLDRNMLNKIGMLHVVKSANVDFMKYAKVAFTTSWVIILIGVGYGIGVRGHNILGVEFAGGNAMKLEFKQKIDPEKIRPVVEKMAGETKIQYQRGAKDETLEIVIPLEKEGKPNSVTDVVGALKTQFPNAGFKIAEQSLVGPTVGEEIQRTAILATFLSLFGILLYVALRYEFSFAVGAVLAIVHDVLMTMGIYFLFQKQMSASFVAAILTIIGFSINDTIVIFDRIREDLKLGVRGTFREVMNKALNQTLSRTIITSGTVFLATLALYFFGGGAIDDFSFAFLVGIITGTYSSIYIASALVLWWHKGERPNIGPVVSGTSAAAATVATTPMATAKPAPAAGASAAKTGV
mgnify:CR=1 FL=1